MLVEQNNAGTQCNPDTRPVSRLFNQSSARWNSRNVDGRVEGRLGRFGLVGRGVDGGQAGLGTRDLTRLSGLFTFVAHDGG